jgi:hypothetical protein
VTLPDEVRVEGELLTARFTWAMRLLTVTVTLAILAGLELPVLAANHSAYTNEGPQYFAFGLFTLVALGEAVTTFRRRLHSPWRWPAVALVLAASAAATATVRPEDLLGIPHWSFGVVGWVLLLLTFGEPLTVFGVLLAVHHLITAGQIVYAGMMAPMLADGLNEVMLAAAFQLSMCVFAVGLRRAGKTTADVWWHGEQERTRAAVAESLHADRLERYAALAKTTSPLLSGLGSGELDPGDEAVRRSCAIEAARMRRLFADTEPVPDPLVHHIQACVELAERRGVRATFAERGEYRDIPKPVRLALTEAAAAALATAQETIRVTVVRTPSAVTVSVVSDAVAKVQAAVAGSTTRDDVTVSTVVAGDRIRIASVWTE